MTVLRTDSFGGVIIDGFGDYGYLYTLEQARLAAPDAIGFVAIPEFPEYVEAVYFSSRHKCYYTTQPGDKTRLWSRNFKSLPDGLMR